MARIQGVSKADAGPMRVVREFRDEVDRQQMNNSDIHVDFMIGSDELAVTGITRDGTEIPLLRNGTWQVL